MVMAKLNRTGNCLHFNLKGSVRSSEGDFFDNTHTHTERERERDYIKVLIKS
jgi:hypothetical protein